MKITVNNFFKDEKKIKENINKKMINILNQKLKNS